MACLFMLIFIRRFFTIFSQFQADLEFKSVVLQSRSLKPLDRPRNHRMMISKVFGMMNSMTLAHQPSADQMQAVSTVFLTSPIQRDRKPHMIEYVKEWCYNHLMMKNQQKRAWKIFLENCTLVIWFQFLYQMSTTRLSSGFISDRRNMSNSLISCTTICSKFHIPFSRRIDLIHSQHFLESSTKTRNNLPTLKWLTQMSLVLSTLRPSTRVNGFV